MSTKKCQFDEHPWYTADFLWVMFCCCCKKQINANKGNTQHGKKSYDEIQKQKYEFALKKTRRGRPR